MLFQVRHSSDVYTYSFTTENNSLHDQFILNPPEGTQWPEPKPQRRTWQEISILNSTQKILLFPDIPRVKWKYAIAFVYILHGNLRKRKTIFKKEKRRRRRSDKHFNYKKKSLESFDLQERGLKWHYQSINYCPSALSLSF